MFFFKKIKIPLAGQWWCTPLIPALRRQGQADLCVFEASLVHSACFRIARTTQRNLIPKIKKSTNKQKVINKQTNNKQINKIL